MRSSILRRWLSIAPVVASVSMSAPAFATKAKMQSLQGAEFLIDSQRVFVNPSLIHSLGNYFTLELGASGAATSPKAEGGLYKDLSGSRVGVYLGHVSAEQTQFRSAAPGFLTEENPFEVFYGVGNWAASVGMSNSKKETTDEEQQTVVARFGMTKDAWTAWVNAEVISKADKAKDSYQGAPLLRAGGSYAMGTLHLAGSVKSGTIKTEVAGASTKTTLTSLELLALDRSIKNETTSIYYGPSLTWSQASVAGKKISHMAAPLYAGIEHSYFDWLDLRASISQNFNLIGSQKNGTATPPGDKTDSIGDNATIAAGVGFKKGQFALDATFAGAATGVFNGNSILGNLGMVYAF